MGPMAEMVQESVNLKVGQSIKIIQSEEHKEKQNKNKKKTKWREHQRPVETIKHTSICIIGTPEGEEKGRKKILEEIIAENHPNLMKNITYPQS